jgi:protein-tyrosine phosphatase
VRPELFTIRRNRPGTLSTMARPRGGDWLEDEMTSLSAAGVGVLVSLLTDAETSELGLSAEAGAAQTSGLVFCRLPTPDRHVPDRPPSLALAATLGEHLAQGASIAVHCRNGIGRASTLAAIVLVQEGIDPHQAWKLISDARGLTVPDTDAQRDFILKLGAAR